MSESTRPADDTSHTQYEARELALDAVLTLAEKYESTSLRRDAVELILAAIDAIVADETEPRSADLVAAVRRAARARRVSPVVEAHRLTDEQAREIRAIKPEGVAVRLCVRTYLLILREVDVTSELGFSVDWTRFFPVDGGEPDARRALEDQVAAFLRGESKRRQLSTAGILARVLYFLDGRSPGDADLEHLTDDIRKTMARYERGISRDAG